MLLCSEIIVTIAVMSSPVQSFSRPLIFRCMAVE